MNDSFGRIAQVDSDRIRPVVANKPNLITFNDQVLNSGYRRAADSLQRWDGNRVWWREIGQTDCGQVVLHWERWGRLRKTTTMHL